MQVQASGEQRARFMTIMAAEIHAHSATSAASAVVVEEEMWVGKEEDSTACLVRTVTTPRENVECGAPPDGAACRTGSTPRYCLRTPPGGVRAS